jgi:hypothetical protein
MNYRYVDKEKKVYTMRDSKDGMLITPTGYDYPSIVLGFDMEDMGFNDVSIDSLLVGEITDHTPYCYEAVFCLKDNIIYYLHRDIPIDILDYEIVIKNNKT